MEVANQKATGHASSSFVDSASITKVFQMAWQRTNQEERGTV
jgi:hypothetical protein